MLKLVMLSVVASLSACDFFNPSFVTKKPIVVQITAALSGERTIHFEGGEPDRSYAIDACAEPTCANAVALTDGVTTDAAGAATFSGPFAAVRLLRFTDVDDVDGAETLVEVEGAPAATE